MKARIVIIGGGVVGVSIALHAARRTDSLSQPVMLLERRELGSGSSRHSAAVLGQFYGSESLAGMARDSLRYYRGIESMTGRSLGFIPTGVLTLSKSRGEKDIQRLIELVDMQESIGIDIRTVHADEIRSLFRGIVVPDDAVGAWEASAGCLDASRSVEALGTLARNRGAIFRTGTLVEGIETRGGRVVGVRTSAGRIECEQVVLAAGAWIQQLLTPLGLALPIRIAGSEQFFIGSSEAALEEVHSESTISMAGPEDSGATGWYSRDVAHAAAFEHEHDVHPDEMPPPLQAPHPVLTDPERGFYARCEPLHSRVRIGRRGYEGLIDIQDPDDFSDQVGADFQSWARAALEARMPAYREVSDVGGEIGLFSMTPDHHAILGQMPGIEGLYVAGGFSGHGFKVAPSVGEGMAQMLMDEPVSAFDPEFFSAKRFENGI